MSSEKRLAKLANKLLMDIIDEKISTDLLLACSPPAQLMKIVCSYLREQEVKYTSEGLFCIGLQDNRSIMFIDTDWSLDTLFTVKVYDRNKYSTSYRQCTMTSYHKYDIAEPNCFDKFKQLLNKFGITS